MKVSLIVPFYGVEKYIAECAESVLSQTYSDIEFIFVDDGSTDRSLEILNGLIDNKFASKKSQISIIRKSNGGLPQARKTGLAAATGEYIMHVDSDDWIDTRAVEKLVLKVEETGADVVYYYVAKEKSGGRTHIAKDREYMDPKAFSNDILHYRAHGYLCNKFMKRSLYTDDLFYPVIAMHEDIVLSSQLLFHAKKAALLPEPLYHYRRNNPSASTRGKRRNRHIASARNLLSLYEF
ncbi:MAG: glycosyltransferase family 2 protein, partial [Bacteroidales bacterium]|nr:glycosyltransferase family 2 protein [Bacteroidales bacterium]